MSTTFFKKNLWILFVVTQWSSFCLPIQRQPRSSTSPAVLRLRKAIEGILPSHKHSDLQWGFYATSLDKDEMLAEHGPDELLIPASVNKLFTAYTALKKLKPTTTFKTTVFASGPIKDGILAGDLYLKGGGDPSLYSERMWMLVNELRRWGIKKITGHIIGDSSYFDLERTPDVRPKYLKDQAYNAPVDALSFNFNTTTIYVRPGETLGSQPIFYTDPENSYIDVVNQATTGRPDTKNTIVVSRTDYVKGDIGDTVLLRGSIPIDHPELRYYRNIVNPTLYTVHMFKTFLEQRGIKIDGVIKEGHVPSNAKQLYEFESLPLWQVVWGMNKFSNNFVADQILKKVGAVSWSPPGTLKKGITALEDALEDIGIARKSYRIVDGSGLTRNTAVSARQIWTVLRAGYKDFSMSSEFIASLGIAGEDGTLKHRFSNSDASHILRAKTGSLDGVTSLAGYISTADREMVAFALLLNDPKQKYGKMTGWADQIATALMKFSRK